MILKAVLFRNGPSTVIAAPNSNSTADSRCNKEPVASVTSEPSPRPLMGRSRLLHEDWFPRTTADDISLPASVSIPQGIGMAPSAETGCVLSSLTC
jgi:hypothetical protein